MRQKTKKYLSFVFNRGQHVYDRLALVALAYTCTLTQPYFLLFKFDDSENKSVIPKHKHQLWVRSD